jgi:uncharacterized Zn-binding protein involved in type VI secretion
MSRYFFLAVWGVFLLAACGGSPVATVFISGSPSTTSSVPSIAFGDEAIGTTSAVKAITLINNGSAGLRIDGIAVALPFAQTNTCGSSLAVGATCTINVTFAPTTEGDFTSNLSITDNAKGSPQRVTLSGTGVAPPPPGCVSQGGMCGPGLPKCCAAPFPHHSFCSNPHGFGTCTES